MSWVLDASAIHCWLADEPGAVRMEEVLGGTEPTFIHAVNLIETEYHLLRRSERALHAGIERIRLAGVEVARDLDDPLLAIVVQLKVRLAPIALGDTFAAALAAQCGATLVTTDRSELGKLEGVRICATEFLR